MITQGFTFAGCALLKINVMELMMKNNRYRYFVKENNDLTYSIFLYDLKYSHYNNKATIHAPVEPKKETYFSLSQVTKRLDILDDEKNNLDGVWPFFFIEEKEKIIIDNSTGKRCYNINEMGKRTKDLFESLAQNKNKMKIK